MIRILARYVGISLLAITLIASVSPAYGVVSGPTAQKPATANGSQVGNNIKAPAKAGPTIYGVKLGVPTDKPIVPGGVAQFTILYQTKKNGPFAPATYYNHTVSLLGVGNAEALDDQGHYQVSLTKNNGEPLPAGEFPVRVKTQNGVFTPGSIFAHEVKVWGVKAEIKNKPPIYVGDPLYFTVSYQLEENGPFYSLTLPNHKIEIKGLGQILPLNQFGQYSVVLKKPTGELLPAGEYVINSAQYNNKGEWEGNLGVDVFTIEESQIFGVKIEYLDPAPYYTGEKVRFRTLYQLEPDGPYVPRSLGAYQLGVKKTDQNLYAPLKKLNQKGYYMATFRGENGVNLPAGTYIYELKDESGKLHFDTIEVADAKVNAVKYQLLSPAQAYGGNTIEFKLNYQLGSSPGFIGKTFTGHSVTVEGSDDAWIAAAYPLDKQGLYQVSLRDKKNQSFPPGSYFVVVNTHEGALGDSGFALGGLVVKDKSSQPPIDPDDILKYSPAIGDKDGGPGDGKLEEIIKKTDDVIIKPVEPRSKEDSGKDRAKEPTASEDPKSAPGVTESGPVIASLAVTNKDNGAWLGTANSGYQTLGTYAAKQLITVPGTIAEVYFKPAIKSQSASDTYGYVWVDSGTGPTNFDATLAAKLAAKLAADEISPSDFTAVSDYLVSRAKQKKGVNSGLNSNLDFPHLHDLPNLPNFSSHSTGGKVIVDTFTTNRESANLNFLSPSTSLDHSDLTDSGFSNSNLPIPGYSSDYKVPSDRENSPPEESENRRFLLRLDQHLRQIQNQNSNLTLSGDSLLCRGKNKWAALARRPRTRYLEQEYLEIRTHLLGEHLFKDSPVKYTKITDTSATWRPGDDQRRPAPINGEGIREIGEIGRTTGRWPTVGVKTG